MKKYEFEYPYDKETTIQQILKGTHKPTFITEDNVIYAKASKNNKFLKLYHGVNYYGGKRNAFRPIFSAMLFDDGEKYTVVRGIWSLSLFATVFSVVWFSFVSKELVSGIIHGNYKQIVVMLAFALFYVLLCGFGIWSERKRMKKIIEHLKNCQARDYADIEQDILQN